ncbi:ATP-binding protein [Sphingomonas jatrophae]|uniref:Helicase HerA central domain-containing protein n=1 Tax=Sphingomonas jatrophae TaxID=1166337 RepID=A0A1I6MD85_9SPHN|nr:ATP-binding protein [Sphingomonas jatrophae]SFS13621.1 hypothetical protein SAMN05192580_3879 [Sphingomonas jatrophae]
MTDIVLGASNEGASAAIDLEELLASRLLVQGNSGSGKSHLLRRLLEQCAGLVQQVVIDPEGDFVTLAERFGHIAIDAADYGETEIAGVAARVRQQRASVVLNLEGLEVDAQLRCAGTFLNGLFDAPRELWYPLLVVVDEAQLFAPAAAGEVNDEARRVSLGAMTNLMCRGRKRGLAGVIATQRLAKLAKNVAAEASNFLMGRTFLDIDMLRAADLLGMERRQAEQIRDLERGQFLALGPALARRPKLMRIGTVETGTRGATPSLSPLPTFTEEDRQSLLTRMPVASPVAQAPRRAEPVEELLSRLPTAAIEPPPPEQPDLLETMDAAALADAVMADIVADEDARYRPASALYQDFTLRCRMQGALRPPHDLAGFSRALALARAGLFSADLAEPAMAEALRASADVPEDMLGVFMLIARAAHLGAPCPTDDAVALVYGTHSTGRVRRMLGYMESRELVAFSTDFRGRRTATIPRLGWSTAPSSDGDTLLDRLAGAGGS